MRIIPAIHAKCPAISPVGSATGSKTQLKGINAITVTRIPPRIGPRPLVMAGLRKYWRSVMQIQITRSRLAVSPLAA